MQLFTLEAWFVIFENKIGESCSYPAQACWRFTSRQKNVFINPSAAIGELLGRLDYLAFVRQLVMEKENFEIQPTFLCSEIDAVFLTACGGRAS